LQIPDAGHFWNQNAVGLRAAGHREIIAPPRRIRALDADQDLALAKALLCDGLRDLLARIRLGVGRDRIFEIEDQPIGREVASLFERAGFGAGHEQQAATRSVHDVSSHAPGNPADTIPTAYSK